MSLFWRIHTTYILVIGFVIVAIASVGAFAVTNFEERHDVRIGSGMYSARLADSQSEREQGLSGVTRLGRGDALLMVFDGDGRWGIWMKDMEIPLDIIWMDKNKTVVHIVKNAQPELSTSQTFAPETAARYVLEVPAGSVSAHSIKIGDIAQFELYTEEVE